MRRVALFIQGRLIWMPVLGWDGRWKSRPVVVVTANKDIATDTVIMGVACSHSAADTSPRPQTYVELPFHPGGISRTKLAKKTVAICDWGVRIEKASIDLKQFGGVVPPQVLERIVELFIEARRQP